MEDIRCVCGKLLAKREGHAIIIKCRHCKRFVVIDLNRTRVLPDSQAESSEEAVAHLQHRAFP